MQATTTTTAPLMLPGTALWAAFDHLRLSVVQLNGAGRRWYFVTHDDTIARMAADLEQLVRNIERIAREADDYHLGRADGDRDGRIIAQPVNTGDHTLQAYIRIRSTYAHALSPRGQAIPYYRGYADALDAVAVASGHGTPTDEQIDAFYLDN